MSYFCIRVYKQTLVSDRNPPLSFSRHRDCVIQLRKDVRGWQFLTIEAAETFSPVCLPPEEHILKKIFG